MEHSYSILSGSTYPNGRTIKDWEHFDQIIGRFLEEQGIPGASVAISKNGKILYQQGYGTAGAGYRVHQDSMFRIASISKPITAAIVIQLFSKLKMSLNTKVFGKTGILKSYRVRDKRVKNITVRHLLQHSAGWDRDKVGDAVFVRPPCVVKEHPDSPAYNTSLLAYALRRKLQFSPGTWHSYSNLGYLILGEVIEALSGQPYPRVLKAFLRDLDIHNIVVGKRAKAHYKCREVEYFNNREPLVVNSIYPGEDTILPQYGGMAMESSGSYGGLVADAVSLLRFVHCMEEAVTQSNADQYRKQQDNTEKDSQIIKSVAEQIGTDFLHCQPVQQLITDAVHNKNTHVNEKIDKDSHYGSGDFSKAESVKLNLDRMFITHDSLLSDINLSSSDDFVEKSVEKPVNMETAPLEPQFIGQPDLYCQLAQQSVINVTCNNNSDVPTSDLCIKNGSKTSEVYATDCDLCRLNSDVAYLKHTHLIDHTYARLAKPLLTDKQAIDSLSRPDYESGHDWYGLGWDVQDNGKSWGHTGGMYGSCGTLFHHHSGLNWAFLLNSWAVDADLNGVMKCALCSVSNVTMYDRDYLNVEDGLDVGIVTRDQSQIIYLCVSESTLSEVISRVKPDGFFITWISTVSQDFSYVADKLLQNKTKNNRRRNDAKPDKLEPDNRYVAVFTKSSVVDYFVFFNKTVSELQSLIHECRKDNFVIHFFDSFMDCESQLRYTAVFKYHESIHCSDNTNHGGDTSHHSDDTIVLLAVAACDYVKYIKRFLLSHYIIVQTVTEVCDELYVSSILYARCNYRRMPWQSQLMKCTVGCVRQPAKTSNELSVSNAKSEMSADVVVDCNHVFRKQNVCVNNDSSCTTTFLHKQGDTVCQESEETKSQKFGQETVFQESVGETTCQKSGEEAVFQGFADETIFHKCEETMCQQSTGDTTCQEFKEKALFQGSTGEIEFEESAEETTVQISAEETAFQESKERTVLHKSRRGTVVQKSKFVAVSQKSHKNDSCEMVLTGASVKLLARSKTSKKSKAQRSPSTKSTHWVQISPESFLTELNRQAKRSNGLVYARFYNSDGKPYVSACWQPGARVNCYQRISMSKYGLVPELVEAAEGNVHLQSLSEYVEEDGVVYYAAIWQAG